MPNDWSSRCYDIKGNHDFGSNNLSQHILSTLMKNGEYAKHVEYLRGVYRRKRDVMVTPSKANSAVGPAFHGPAQGRNVRLADDAARDPDIAGRCIPQRGVPGRRRVYIPGEFGHVSEDRGRAAERSQTQLRRCSIEQIREGMKRLRRAAESVAGRRQVQSVAV